MEFYVFRCADNEWRWHLRAADGKFLAASPESYKTETDCLVVIGWVKRAGSATVVSHEQMLARSA